MAQNKVKKTKKIKKTATSTVIVESAARRLSSEKKDPPKTARRFHEVFGILTLAAVLLLGPSLISVQFGKGSLMGPFGKTLGTVLNDIFGLSGYLIILALLVAALRIFAGGLGIKSDGAPMLTFWRERIGFVLATLFISIMMHLIFRPTRLHGASFGGIVGEVSVEVMCSLVSTPGAWILGLAGFILSVVLTTPFSLARTGLWIWRLSHHIGPLLERGFRRSQAHLRSAFSNIAQLLRRREISAEANGTATMPPVVRMDLSKKLGTEIINPEPRQLIARAMISASQTMPKDLEIESQGEEVATPIMDQPGKTKPQELSLSAEEDNSKKPSRPGVKETENTEVPQIKALTIVEPRYGEKSSTGEEIEESQDDINQSQGKLVSQTDGPGFVLHNETYLPPPLGLLELKDDQSVDLNRDAIYQQAELLVKTLGDYKIDGRVTEVHPGPVVTMYEFVPAPGIRISKVANLANDLAMSLAARRVRIVAPIPGKGAIGIEVPNDKRTTVYFKEIVSHKAFRKSKSPLTLAMGKNIVGAPVTLDLAKMPHLLVAGATGAGKSVSINAMICSLLLKSTPEEVRMIMVDPKYLELSGYNDIPHLMLPVVTDPTKANTALRWAVREMERRYQLLADMKVRDIKSYNRKVERIRAEEGGDQAQQRLEIENTKEPTTESIEEARPSEVVVVRKSSDGSEESLEDLEKTQQASEEKSGEEQSTKTEPIQKEEPPTKKPKKKPRRKGPLPKCLPYIVVVIDEFADLMMVASKEVETSVARLAQKARAAGIHVILATQRPSVDVITGLIKANFPSRISFQVASGHDSKTILGAMGAENLLGAGDMLVLDRGAEMKRLHGAFISDDEIQRVVDHLKEQGKPIYDMDILRAPDEDEAANEATEPTDEMYDMAVALVAESRQASVSMIQRRLRIGYNRAARIVEQMEKEGVVGPADGVRGREVLISPL